MPAGTEIYCYICSGMDLSGLFECESSLKVR
jgi:hypothetical protein